MKNRDLIKWGCVIFGLAFCMVLVVFIFSLIVGLRGTQLPSFSSSGGGTPNPGASAGTYTGVGCGNVPIFKQCDSRWGSNQYGNCSGQSTICSSGCGVTSAAMVLSFYGVNVDPAMMATESANNGFRVCGSGTSHGFFPFIAKKYGLKADNNISWNEALEYLKSGVPVIASGNGAPPFTGGGHYVVLTCANADGTISVNDSAHGPIGNRNYPASLIQSEQHFLTAIHP